MKALATWIVGNPQAFRAFLVTFLGMLFKLILQLSGKSAELAQYNDAAAQVLDIAVYLIMGWGVIVGGVHAARGPVLTSTDQASVIVAALAPAPVELAVQQVKTVAEQLEAVKTAPETFPESSHKF
jgi:hypothetical protein